MADHKADLQSDTVVLTIDELADLTKMDREAIRSRVRRGTLQARKNNAGKWQIHVSPTQIERLRTDAEAAGQEAEEESPPADREPDQAPAAADHETGRADLLQALAAARGERDVARAEVRGEQAMVAELRGQIALLRAELVDLRRPWPVRWYRAMRG